MTARAGTFSATCARFLSIRRRCPCSRHCPARYLDETANGPVWREYLRLAAVPPLPSYRVHRRILLTLRSFSTSVQRASASSNRRADRRGYSLVVTWSGRPPLDHGGAPTLRAFSPCAQERAVAGQATPTARWASTAARARRSDEPCPAAQWIWSIPAEPSAVAPPPSWSLPVRPVRHRLTLARPGPSRCPLCSRLSDLDRDRVQTSNSVMATGGRDPEMNGGQHRLPAGPPHRGQAGPGSSPSAHHFPE